MYINCARFQHQIGFVEENSIFQFEDFLKFYNNFFPPKKIMSWFLPTYNFIGIVREYQHIWFIRTLSNCLYI